MTSAHPLAAVLDACGRGDFPPVDGVVEVVPPDAHDTWAIAEFTGHALVRCDKPPDDMVFAGVDAFGGVTQPDFVLALAGSTTSIGSHDAVLVRRGDGGAATSLTRTDAFDGHPRVVRARRHRSAVTVLGDERGLVTVGSGLLGRTEISVEVTPDDGAHGVGRDLVTGGLATVPDDS